MKLSGAVPPAVTRSEDEEREDLVRDLEALRGAGERYPIASATCTRPAILRRLAALAARRIGPETDRLVATAQDGVLAAAVSLHTGIPFALVEGSRPVMGDLHRGERAVFVAYLLDPALAGDQTALAVELELDLGGRITVFAEPGRGADAAAIVLVEGLSSATASGVGG